MTTPPTIATIGIQSPPPPYNPFIPPAATATSQLRQNNSSCLNNRGNVKNRAMSTELRNALLHFRMYKRALGTTLLCSTYYIVYMLVMALLFRNRDVSIAFLAMSTALLMGNAAVFAKIGAWLIPTFIIFVLLVFLNWILFAVMAFWLITEDMQIKALIACIFEPVTSRIVLCFGLSYNQVIVGYAILFFIGSIVTCHIASEIFTAMTGMSYYCKELHKMAMSMLGYRTNLTNRTLINHLQKHIDANAKAVNNPLKTV